MHGLVHGAFAELVRARFGDETWRVIRSRAGIDADAGARPDEDTLRLAAAAGEVLNLPPAVVLETFGRFWVLYTAREGYGDLLRAAGRNLVEVLTNLDALHARVGVAFPRFRVSDVTADSLRLHYRSPRPGLAPMVVGALEALSARFSTPIHVEHDRRVADGADHDEFLIRFVAVRASENC